MRLIFVALLAAISYAQTGENKVAASGDPAAKLADSTGAQIDDSEERKAKDEWNKAKNDQATMLDQLEEELKRLTEHIKKITDHRSVYDGKEDRKNQVDSLIEGESINYIAAELMELKKKIDQAITERDALIDKFVPKLKNTMKKREGEMNTYWEGKNGEWKAELDKMHQQIAQLKADNKAALDKKDAEIEQAKQDGSAQLKQNQKDHQDQENTVRGEMEAANQKNQETINTLNSQQQEKDTNFRQQINEGNEKNAQDFETLSAKLKDLTKQNAQTRIATEGTYKEKINALNAKADSEKKDSTTKLQILQSEVHELQQQAIRADATKVRLVAEEGKVQSDWQAAEREKFAKHVADIDAKKKQETENALKTQADAAAETMRGVNEQNAERMNNLKDSQQKSNERGKKKEEKYKKRIEVAQIKTDKQNKKLRVVQTALDDLRTSAMSPPSNSETADTETFVAAPAQPAPFGGLNMNIVGVLVAINIFLAALALSYYYEGEKLRNFYPGLIESHLL